MLLTLLAAPPAMRFPLLSTTPPAVRVVPPRMATESVGAVGTAGYNGVATPTGRFRKSDTSALLHGGSLRTWSYDSPDVKQLEVALATEGGPLEAEVELWHGPDNTPCMIRSYVEDGAARPFSAVLSTSFGPSTVAIRNTGELTFPISADVYAENFEFPTNGYMEPIHGGSLRTFQCEPSVESVQVLLETDGRPLNARLELLQGPNNNKQVIELYAEDGYYFPFLFFLPTPGYGNVVRVVNTAPVEFPLTATVEPRSMNNQYRRDSDVPPVRAGPGGSYGTGSYNSARRMGSSRTGFPGMGSRRYEGRGRRSSNVQMRSPDYGSVARMTSSAWGESARDRSWNRDSYSNRGWAGDSWSSGRNSWSDWREPYYSGGRSGVWDNYVGTQRGAYGGSSWGGNYDNNYGSYGSYNKYNYGRHGNNRDSFSGNYRDNYRPGSSWYNSRDSYSRTGTWDSFRDNFRDPYSSRSYVVGNNYNNNNNRRYNNNGNYRNGNVRDRAEMAKRNEMEAKDMARRAAQEADEATRVARVEEQEARRREDEVQRLDREAQIAWNRAEEASRSAQRDAERARQIEIDAQRRIGGGSSANYQSFPSRNYGYSGRNSNWTRMRDQGNFRDNTVYQGYNGGNQYYRNQPYGGSWSSGGWGGSSNIFDNFMMAKKWHD